MHEQDLFLPDRRGGPADGKVKVVAGGGQQERWVCHLFVPPGACNREFSCDAICARHLIRASCWLDVQQCTAPFVYWHAWILDHARACVRGLLPMVGAAEKHVAPSSLGLDLTPLAICELRRNTTCYDFMI